VLEHVEGVDHLIGEFRRHQAGELDLELLDLRIELGQRPVADVARRLDVVRLDHVVAGRDQEGGGALQVGKRELAHGPHFIALDEVTDDAERQAAEVEGSDHRQDAEDRQDVIDDAEATAAARRSGNFGRPGGGGQGLRGHGIPWVKRLEMPQSGGDPVKIR
jgi:hypothetical protein